MSHEFRADLHCHSTCSDGSDHPLVLLELAKQANLNGLSITDHDSIDAYTAEFFSLANDLGISILPGIELSSELNDQTVHVLGYGFDVQSSSLHDFLKEMNERRANRNRKILQKLSNRKMSISEEELLEFTKDKTVGRPHIAQLMVKKNYVRSTKEAFDNYLQEGGLCYAPGIKFSPLEVIEQIHLAKGKAVLAHPHFIKKGKLLRQLLELPFDGIECYYGNLNKHLELPWLKIAKEKNWIATGGSDYHGDLKPHIFLGSSWVNETTFQKLIAPF